MVEVRTVHTAELGADGLRAVRRLVADAFGTDFDDENFEHALGGMHALLSEDGALVAHGAVIQRRLLHGGRALRTGYVEAVAVRADRRRSGLGAGVMSALNPVLRGGYEIGALSASVQALDFYPALGWRPWPGTLSVLTPRGIVAMPEESGGVFVLPFATKLEWDGELTCDWRNGDVW
jgi:aminoglycoside 2'-N-acetyltransferase I